MSIVARVGRLKERSRFRRGAGHSARDSFFQAAGFRLGDDGQWTAAKEGLEDEEPADEPVGRYSKEGQWFIDDRFPQVPYEELDERKWEVVMAQPWRRAGESIFVYEARALLSGLECVVSKEIKCDVRCLSLVDSMGGALSFPRRRSRHVTVLTIIRRFSAMCMSLGVRCSIRWIPTEVKIADEPSRRFDKLESFKSNVFSKVAVQVQDCPIKQSSREEATPRPAAADYIAAKSSADVPVCRPERRAAPEPEPERECSEADRSSGQGCAKYCGFGKEGLSEASVMRRLLAWEFAGAGVDRDTHSSRQFGGPLLRDFADA